MTHVPDLDDTPAGRLRKLDQAVARLRYADHRDPEAFHGQERDPRRAAQVGRRVGPAAAVRCDRARPRRLVGDDVRITTANTRLQARRRRRAAQSRRHRLRLPGIDLFQWADLALHCGRSTQ